LEAIYILHSWLCDVWLSVIFTVQKLSVSGKCYYTLLIIRVLKRIEERKEDWKYTQKVHLFKWKFYSMIDNNTFGAPIINVNNNIKHKE